MFISLLTSVTFSQTSEWLTISAEVTDQNGTIIDGNIEMWVYLYDAETGGTRLRSESFLKLNQQAVSVVSGVLSVQLGKGTSDQNLGTVIQENSTLYAEIALGENGDDILGARIPLTAAPFVLKTNSVLEGTVDPDASVVGKLGAFYVNTISNSTWIKTKSSWVLLN
jgi:hypothetical protein